MKQLDSIISDYYLVFKCAPSIDLEGYYQDLACHTVKDYLDKGLIDRSIFDKMIDEIEDWDLKKAIERVKTIPQENFLTN